MVRTAGNTSPWEDSTMLTSVARFNAGITYDLKADLYNLWFLLVSGLNYMSSLYKLWAQREQSQKRSSSKYCKHTRQPLRGNWRTTFLFSRSAKGTLPKGREHCRSASCKGAKENANNTSMSAGLHTLYSFGANGPSRFQIPASRFQIQGSDHLTTGFPGHVP
uniref:Uncharacterized protein n=1 Tax=Brassica oleracea TaxID=3712 RepID=A0A3P6DV05_BRAOL|nr:unnamed protein product [Brassica oleracea]